MANERRTTIYTGMTNDLERRYFEHRSHAVPGFTKRYNLDCLVYAAFFASVVQAIAYEKQIKGWSRAKKIALITAENPNWNDLGDEWFQVPDSSLRSE